MYDTSFFGQHTKGHMYLGTRDGRPARPLSRNDIRETRRLSVDSHIPLSGITRDARHLRSNNCAQQVEPTLPGCDKLAKDRAWFCRFEQEKSASPITPKFPC